MSIREMTVPKSLDVQRTKARMLPGANDRTPPVTIDLLVLNDTAESDTVFDAFLEPQNFDLREIAHAALPRIPRPAPSAVHSPGAACIGGPDLRTLARPLG
ncbi:hypothetical protein ABIF52_000485 [Bradyrhizobium japonicum]